MCVHFWMRFSRRACRMVTRVMGVNGVLTEVLILLGPSKGTSLLFLFASVLRKSVI